MNRKRKQIERPKKIVLSANETAMQHRAAILNCPWCDHHMDGNKWLDTAFCLILEPRFQRAGSVALMSECPKCFEISWIHQTMNSFLFGERFPKTWSDVVLAKSNRMKIEAARQWARGLCVDCRHLEEVKIDYTPWRSCPKGFGAVANECSSFEKVEACKMDSGK